LSVVVGVVDPVVPMLTLWRRSIRLGETLIGGVCDTDCLNRKRDDHDTSKHRRVQDCCAPWHASPPNSEQKMQLGFEMKVSDADWKWRLGLQYVAISTSTVRR
jgi:hypothetical protein